MAVPWIEMQVEEITSDGDAHAVLLVEVRGSRRATITVSAPEAGLLRELHGVHSRLSHVYELATMMLDGVHGRVVAARLTSRDGGGLDGEVAVARRWRRRWVLAHPGDAVALAIRLGLPVSIPASFVHHPGPRRGQQEDESVTVFRQFLDGVTADDFR